MHYVKSKPQSLITPPSNSEPEQSPKRYGILIDNALGLLISNGLHILWQLTPAILSYNTYTSKHLFHAYIHTYIHIHIHIYIYMYIYIYISTYFRVPGVWDFGLRAGSGSGLSGPGRSWNGVLSTGSGIPATSGATLADKSHYDRLFYKIITSRSPFASIWTPTWAQLGLILGSKTIISCGWDGIFQHFPNSCLRTPKMASRWTQEGLKRPPESPKRPQESPKKPQETPKGGPKGGKRGSRTAQVLGFGAGVEWSSKVGGFRPPPLRLVFIHLFIHIYIYIYK